MESCLKNVYCTAVLKDLFDPPPDVEFLKAISSSSLARTCSDWNRLNDSEKGAAVVSSPPSVVEAMVVVVVVPMSSSSLRVALSAALRLRRRTAGGPWGFSRQLQGSV